MSTTAVLAMHTNILLGGYDASNLFSSAEQAADREYVDTSVFGLGDKTGLASIRAATLSCEGFRKGTLASYQDAVNRILSADNSNLLLYSPEGNAVGEDCVLMKVYENNIDITSPVRGAVMFNMNFIDTGGARNGKVLNTHWSSSATVSNETQTVTFTSAPASQEFALRRTGQSATATITPASNNAAIKAALESIYGGTITVTGTLTLTNGTYSGTLTINFGGSLAGTNVELLEVLSSESETLTLTGTSGAGSWRGASVTAGNTASAVQTALRATGGSNANVVVEGSSTATATGFTVEGAGDGSYNGYYTQAGTLNGQPYYSNPDTRVIYYSSNTWCMYTSAGGGPPAYTKSGTTPTDIPGTWSQVMGSSPAPTVTASGGANLMTGGTASAQSTNGAASASQAFDSDDSDTFWEPTTLGHTVTYDRGAGNAAIPGRYVVKGTESSSSAYPSAWTLEGSNDNSAWTTLDTKTGQNTSTVVSTGIYSSISTATAYRYFRLTVTATSGSAAPRVRNFKVFEAAAGGSGSYRAYWPYSVGNIALGSVSGTGFSVANNTNGATASTTIVPVVTAEGGGVNYAFVSASFNGTSIDNAAATTRGAVAHLHAVYANGAGKTVTVKIQHSSDNGVGDAWSDLITFTALTNIGAERKVLADGVTVKRYVRAVVASGAITGTWAFSVALSRFVADA